MTEISSISASLISLTCYIIVCYNSEHFMGTYNTNYDVIISLPNTYVFLLMLWILEDLTYRFNTIIVKVVPMPILFGWY